MTKVCLGAGFLALDILEHPEKKDLITYCGGSLGNVCSILANYGWDSYPIARLRNDKAAQYIVDDLLKLGVHTDLVEISSKGLTPIVFQRNLIKNGQAIHKFQFYSRGQKVWRPIFRLPLLSSVNAIQKELINVDVFYFDRVSPAILRLAEFYKLQGALIYFEPSSFGELQRFIKAVSLSDIIKFSNSNISEYSKVIPRPIGKLEIETLGSYGLRYRRSCSERWKQIESLKAEDVKDTSGAGDWFSATLIDKISELGKLPEEAVLPDILYNCQKNSTKNCRFYGAKGLLYGKLNSIYGESLSLETSDLSDALKSLHLVTSNTKINQI